MKRTTLRRRNGLRRTRLARQSAGAAERAQERRHSMLAAFGRFPDCVGQGVIPVCPRRRHDADDAHEPAKRSQGADAADPTQAIPLCRAGHDWVHANPAAACELRTTAGRALLIQRSSRRPSG